MRTRFSASCACETRARAVVCFGSDLPVFAA